MTTPILVLLSQNGELALSLAARGWYVFPCREQPGEPYTTKEGKTVTPQAKAPYWDKNDLRNGKDDATPDVEKIRRWWGRWPGALVGIYCEKSGIWALDIDRKNGTDGAKTFDELVRTHGAGQKIPVGIMQSTPTGGMHLLFNLPQDGAKIPNNAGKLGAGLDLRSDGYICTGKLPDGSGYSWLKPAENPGDWRVIDAPGDAVTSAPGWLVELASKTDKQSTQPTDAAARPATDSGAYWLQHYLAGAVNGNRNNNGFALACQLRDSGLSMGEATRIMCQYAARVPGDGYSESEALASLEQAYQSSRREPARITGITAPGVQSSTPPATQPGRFRILTAADALLPQKPVSWLVDKLFTAGSLNILFGLPGAKKTWALLDMAVCVASGAQWLGMSTQTAPVLVVDEESGERRLLRRLGEVIRGHGRESENLPISALSLAGFNFRNSEDVNRVHEFILQTGAGVVVIDALADVMPGADENAVKDVQPVMLALRQVAERTRAAIILIHHANKTGLQYRGSTALPGAVDCMVQVTSDTGDNKINFDIVKSRDGEPFKFAAAAWWGEDAFNLSQAAGKPSLDTIILQTLEGQSLTQSALIDAVRRSTGSGQNSIRNAVVRLESESKITATIGANNSKVYSVFRFYGGSS